MAVTERIEQNAPEIQDLRQRVSSQPSELQPILELGWALYGREQTEEALKTWAQAQERFPENPEIQYALGLAYKRSGEKRKAQTAFKQALDFLQGSPDNVRYNMLRRLSERQIKML